MLQNIRDNSQGTMAKIIIGIMIVPFALFGIDSLFSSAPEGGEVAKVNGEAITETDVNREMNQQLQRLQSQFGEGFDASQFDAKILRTPALNQLIDDRILLQQARTEDLMIADGQLDKMIVADPAFQEDGKFSTDRFVAILRSAGFTPTTYKAFLSSQLLMNQYSNGIAGSDFATAAELDAASKLLKQKRSGGYVVVPEAMVRDQVEVSDGEVASYYADNKSSFMTEEKVAVSYIELNITDLFKPIAEDVLKEQYKQQLAQEKAVTERHVAHIMIALDDDTDLAAAKEKIVAIKARLDAGEDFASVAEEASEDVGSAALGGDLGVTTGDTFPPAFETAIASLDAGALSEPVVTDDGVHLIKVISVDKSTPASFAERRDEIERTLQRDQASVAYVQLLEELKDYTFNASDLKGPAEELGLKVSTSKLFERKGGASIFANPEVVKAAFSADVLNDGNNSEVVEISDTHAVVMHLEKHVEAELMPLASVSSEIRAQLKQQKLSLALDEMADKVVDSSAESLAAVAKQYELEVKTIASVTREAAGSLPPEIAKTLFTMPRVKLSSFEKVRLASGDIAIVSLATVEDGEISAVSAKEREYFSNYVARSNGSQSLVNIRAALKREADIETL
ncbi:peptidyl-prolyl cis-trans isomerase D [Sinobacterium caligoides]|uniref:Periplasmic chaperone PpiD n=1 Tax=Sinobacterium caligoides TaxID=933926 RepID=A0A3N2DJP8_9GAMM|nr:SurA N-terminal domain-containing protein [Sinobacterium caligoides]ROS00020.1 peptidyl-prolyl cis-trans isomerase D [Sinobacterium caligoides]